jgi:hypothetical protein
VMTNKTDGWMIINIFEKSNKENDTKLIQTIKYFKKYNRIN